MSDPTRAQRIRGSLLAGAAGDALGAPVEFISRPRILKFFGPKGVAGYVENKDGKGRITDDTQLTLFTAEGIELRPENPLESVWEAYLRWNETQKKDASFEKLEPQFRKGHLIRERQLYSYRAPGATCIGSLSNGVMGTPENALNSSKGCGTVMRAAPPGLVYSPDRAFEYGKLFSAMTHGHPTAYLAGAALSMLVACLVQGDALERAAEKTMIHTALQDNSQTVFDRMDLAVRLANADLDPVPAIARIGEGWVAEDALAIALYCALKFRSNLRAALLTAVNITGDSDSAAAVTGNILGAMLGEDAIPKEWLDNLTERRIVEDQAERLLKIKL